MTDAELDSLAQQARDYCTTGAIDAYIAAVRETVARLRKNYCSDCSCQYGTRTICCECGCHDEKKCSECGSEDAEYSDYDFGQCSETGYRDAGVRGWCRKCGHEGEADKEGRF